MESFWLTKLWDYSFLGGTWPGWPWPSFLSISLELRNKKVKDTRNTNKRLDPLERSKDHAALPSLTHGYFRFT